MLNNLKKDVKDITEKLNEERKHTSHMSETVTRFSSELDCSRTENERLRILNDKFSREMDTLADTLAAVREDNARKICYAF